MVRERVIETMEGIQDAFDVSSYDRMMRKMWKRGWIETKEVMNSGIVEGLALEISPGPGYLGIDWLQQTQATRLVGLDISEEMLKVSRENARLEGVSDRASYVHGDACEMPFETATFDAVFTNGGMHEWANPVDVFDEIARVLKPGGRYCITDLRRDASVFIRTLLPLTIRERAMRHGFTTSVNAAYTPNEVRLLVTDSALFAPQVSGNAMGLVISGMKP
jgi:ubiquinone/menaquinone biosynthesis C-methylase UbiE